MNSRKVPEYRPNSSRATRPFLDLDGSNNDPSSRKGNPIEICRIFDVLSSCAVDDVMDGKINGKAEIYTERIDANPLNGSLFDKKKRGGL